MNTLGVKRVGSLKFEELAEPMPHNSMEASPPRDELADDSSPNGNAEMAYNSTENFRDGVNEMIEDEAHMA